MIMTRHVFAATCGAAALCLAGSYALAGEPAAAPVGEVAMAETTLTATVKSVDQATREVVLTDKEGGEFSFIAGEDVQNLAQLEAGDVVNVTYAEALAYEVKKGGEAVAAVTDIAGGRASPGSKPAGAIGSQTFVVVKIIAIDPSVPSVTFQAANGETRTLKVQRPEKLEGVSVGDTVEILYTEAIGLRVTEAAAN